MIDPSRTVALVGRPNVGKSRSLIGFAVSACPSFMICPSARDLISTEVRDDYVLLIPAVGMGSMTSKKISVAVEEQVEFAIQAASVILFVVDVREGITNLDEIVAHKLRRYGKHVSSNNKVDLEDNED